jgi:CHAT domain-containing protein
MNIEISEPQNILDVLVEWMSKPTVKSAKNFLEQHPEILSEQAETLLKLMKKKAQTNGDEHAVQVFSKHHLLLQHHRANLQKVLCAKLESPENFCFYVFQAKLAEDFYLRNNDCRALDAAINIWQHIFTHPDFNYVDINFRLNMLSEIGTAYFLHYQCTNALEDLTTGLSYCQKALKQTPSHSPEFTGRLNDLANGLHDRYTLTGDFNDLQEAIKLYRQAVQNSSQDSPELPIYLNNLGSVLKDHYLYMGKIEDLQQSITYFEQAIDKYNQESSKFVVYLNNLGLGLRERYSCVGNLDDLQRAIDIFKQTVKMTKQNSPSYLNTLGAGLRDRYLRLGALEDLQQAIDMFEQAIQKNPDDSPDLPKYLYSLSTGLSDRYFYTGTLEDLQRAIQIGEQAIQKTPQDAPEWHRYLNSLGVALRLRYDRTGAVDDLQKSIEIFEQAIQKTPPNSPELIRYLNNLANGLRNRYARTSTIEYLNQAIDIFEQVVSKTPELSTHLPMLLSNFGLALCDRYVHLKTVDDLLKAVDVFEQALQKSQTDSIERVRYYNNLGYGLLKLYSHTEQFTILQKAINAFEQAVQKTPLDSTELPIFLNNLGYGLSFRYNNTHQLEDLEQGIKHYEQATKLGLKLAVQEGLRSSYYWIEWAFTRQAWKEIEQAYGYAHQASEQLLKVQLLRQDKESWLKNTQGLAAKAAYAFAQNNKFQEATIALEGGLARLLSEAVARDRANLEQIKTTDHAELYTRYKNVVEQWQFLTQQAQLTEKHRIQLRATRKELDATIKAIQQIKDYENFLIPAGDADIQTAAAINPLVYIVTTDAGGLALIVDKNNLNPVWLPELIEKVLIEKLQAYFENDYSNWLKAVATIKVAHDALEKLKKDENATTEEIEKAQTVWQQTVIFEQNARAKWEQTLANITHWLWQTVMSPIIDALPKPATVTLIPAGLLCLLPLQAAWTHDDTNKTGKRYALDELTICYAPNARALKEAHALAQQVNADKLLVIENPSKDLPYSAHEVNSIQTTFINPDVLGQESATQEAVLNALPDYNVLHFSCHGHTNFEKPLQSGLLMANKQEITLEELLKKHLKVRLATLSACETGLSGTTLPDEVVSLSSGLLQAGVAGVAASLWSVSELSTTLLMTRFYELWQHEQLSPVEALRQSQQWVRDSTYGEMLNYCKLVVKDTRLVKRFRKEIGFARMDERGFEHPFYWGAFTYVGI